MIANPDADHFICAARNPPAALLGAAQNDGSGAGIDVLGQPAVSLTARTVGANFGRFWGAEIPYGKANQRKVAVQEHRVRGINGCSCGEGTIRRIL